jgi:hypothetical protein
MGEFIDFKEAEAEVWRLREALEVEQARTERLVKIVRTLATALSAGLYERIVHAGYPQVAHMLRDLVFESTNDIYPR